MKTASGLYEHFGDRDIELATFEHDITLTGWAEKYRIGELDLGPIFWAPIATLTPPRLADGKGASTNLSHRSSSPTRRAPPTPGSTCATPPLARPP